MNTLVVDEEIILKEIELEDADVVYNSVNAQRKYLQEWLPFVEYTRCVVDEKNFINSVLNSEPSVREFVNIILYRNEFAGLISLKFNKADKLNKKTEIGYWLSEKFQKRGIINRSCKRLISYAFDELLLNRIQIKIAVNNAKSIKIAERLNFIFEGIERDGELLDNGFTDLNIYSLLKKEYDKNRNKYKIKP